MATNNTAADYNETKISNEVHSVKGARLTLGDEVHIVECRKYVGCRPMSWHYDGVEMSKAECNELATAFAAKGATQEAL